MVDRCWLSPVLMHRLLLHDQNLGLFVCGLQDVWLISWCIIFHSRMKRQFPKDYNILSSPQSPLKRVWHKGGSSWTQWKPGIIWSWLKLWLRPGGFTLPEESAAWNQAWRHCQLSRLGWCITCLTCILYQCKTSWSSYPCMSVSPCNFLVLQL